MRPFHPSRLLAAGVLAAGAFGLAAAPALEPVPIKAPAPAPAKAGGPVDESGVRALLKTQSKFDGNALALQDILATLAKEYGLTVRIDLAGFKRLGTFEAGGAVRAEQPGPVLVALRFAQPINDIQEIYDVKVRVSASAGLTLADLLTDVCAQLPGKCAYRIRHNQVLIGPAFQPPGIPGAADTQLAIPPALLTEQLLGEPVSLAIEDRPLTEAVAELRKITGANIVLDARTKEKSKQVVSGTFDDVRLLTALELLADMCDLKVVSNNNVFYVTSVENAAKMQKQIHRDLFGEPLAPAIAPAKDETKK